MLPPALKIHTSLSGLDVRADSLVKTGWASRTRSGYASAVKRFLKFTTAFNLDPFPLDEQVLLRYIAYLDIQGLAPATVRNYLAAIRAWYISLGLKEPLIWTPRVHLACRALTRTHPPPRQVSPISFPILSSMVRLLSPSRDHVIIASALSLQFFACLRASELCSDLTQALVPTRSDVQFNTRGQSPIMLYSCSASKTSIHGFKVHVGCSGAPLCAVCIMHHYINTFPALPSDPLFAFSSGQHLTYEVYNSWIKYLVRGVGLDPSNYSSHSVRAGAATQAAQAGLGSDSIKRLGRWRSQAYAVYLRPPPESYAAFAPRLVPSSSSHASYSHHSS